MHVLGRTVLQFILVVGKLFMLRAFASGPISRKDEARLKTLMASEPRIWGSHGRQAAKA